MDVPKLVQEETLIEPLARVYEDRPAECKACHVGGAERPSADPKRKASKAKPRFAKLRKTLAQFRGELDFPSGDCFDEASCNSHLSPRASSSIV